jgi:MYXO-CTERM domain-containing protein
MLVLLAGCTLNGSGPTPVTARPPPDPDRMPSGVLDKQDPAADTSRNPVLSTTGASYHGPDGVRDNPLFGCLRMLSCNAGGGDASGLLIVIAALAATRRRKRS